MPDLLFCGLDDLRQGFLRPAQLGVFLKILFFKGVISLKSFSNLVCILISLFCLSFVIPNSFNILLFLFIIDFAVGNKAKSLFNSDFKSSELLERSIIFIDFISFKIETLINFNESFFLDLGLK